MTDGNGYPPASAEKSLGDIVGDVSQKASLLVREEIELAKAEIQLKIQRMIKGIVFGAIGGVFLVLVLIYLLHGLSWFWNDLFNFDRAWPGFLITSGLLLLLGALCGLLALRFFKKATPARPELAIEEAQKTKASLQEARG